MSHLYKKSLIEIFELYSVDNAIQRLKNIFGEVKEWTNFLSLIPILNGNKIINKSILSSNFVASLELAKNGYIEVKQNNIFGNIFVKLKL
jgi:segregation and condensation protein A